MVQNLLKKHKYPPYNDLVELYQLHRHFRRCHQYMNQVSRFKLFTNRIIIAEPLSENIPENDKFFLLPKQSDMLTEVKNYINSYLRPSIINFSDSSQDDLWKFSKKSVTYS